MIRVPAIATIVSKEFRGYLNSPAAYLVLVVFLVLWQFLFFRNVFLVGEASLRIAFSFVPWLFIILVPAFTMGSISSEKSEGTLEYLLTSPIRILELVIGKILATTGFVSLALLATIPLALSLNQFTAAQVGLDWGVVVTQILASMLMALVFSSIGVAISSFFTSQITSLLVSVAVSFVMVILGFELITLSLPNALAVVFEQVSVLSRFESMARGVVDLSDVLYFLAITLTAILLASVQLLRIRLGNQSAVYRQWVVVTGLSVAVVVLLGVVGGRVPGRLDLTENQAYTLSPVTKNTLSGLDDVINIKLYASQELPPQLRPILRDTKDMLRDYRIAGGGKVLVSIKNPSNNPDVVSEATGLGIQEVQFNVIGQEEFQVKKGFLGLAVSYQDQAEVIPLISTAQDLEYQLTSLITKLVVTDKPQVVMAVGQGQKTSIDYMALSTELGKQYLVREMDLSTEDASLSADVAAVIVAGPTQSISEEARKLLDDYFVSGGSVMYLADGVTISPGSLSAASNDNSLADFLVRYGVALGQDVVYDLRSNEVVNFGGGQVNFTVRYPFWVRAFTAPEHPITSRLSGVALPWPSSLTLNQETLSAQGLTAQPLLVTSSDAGTQIGSFNLQPNQEYVPTELSEKTLAVAITSQAGGRLVVVADSDFLMDDFVANSPENIGFGLESVSFLTQSQSLSEIQLKAAINRSLFFTDPSQQTLIKYGNIALVVVVPLSIALVRLTSRHRLRFKPYQKEVASA